MSKNGSKTKRARWMLYVPAVLFIVFFVWIVKIAFDMVGGSIL
jgi:hypothetical protein